MTSPSSIPSRMEEIAGNIVRDVAELPDRTSPGDEPETMLVTSNELEAIIKAELASTIQSAQAEEREACAKELDRHRQERLDESLRLLDDKPTDAAVLRAQAFVLRNAA